MLRLYRLPHKHFSHSAVRVADDVDATLRSGHLLAVRGVVARCLRIAVCREVRRSTIRNRVSVHQRPPEADGRRFGDWEIDLIVDRHNNAILTLVERSTNFLIMERIRQGRKAMPLVRTVWRLLMPYKATLRIITTDNGGEFAEHEWISRRLGVPIFFTDSYCSWQKGAVENENKLARQYIPKGMDISKVSDARIMAINKKINARPREKLNFFTPEEVFYKNIS